MASLNQHNYTFFKKDLRVLIDLCMLFLDKKIDSSELKHPDLFKDLVLQIKKKYNL